MVSWLLPFSLTIVAATRALAAAPGVRTAMAFSCNATWPYAHNSAWTTTPGGHIAVVMQASRSNEGAATQVIFIATSGDGGASFSEPRIIAGNGSAAVWAPVLFTDGAVLRMFFAQAPASSPSALCGDLLMTASSDDGDSWGVPELVLPMAAWGGGVKCPDNKPLRVAPVQWTLPFFSSNAIHGQNGSAASGLIAARAGAGLAGPWALLPGRIPSPDTSPSYFPEPAIASCDGSQPARLLALLRNYDFSWSSSSADGGTTWTPLVPTKLTNPFSKVDLAQWEEHTPHGPQPGALLLAHNPVTNCTTHTYCIRSPLGVSWSPDCGVTWSRPLLIEPMNASYAFGYPTIAPCGTRRVCVSYTLDNKRSLGIRFASFDADMLLSL